LRRRIFRSIGIIGGLLTALSVVWEYARMNPSYRFLVDPWSFRGYESVHGAIALVLGLTLAVIALVTKSTRSTERQPAIVIVVATVVAAIVIAFVFDPGDDIGFNAFLAIVFGFLLGLIAMRLNQRRLIRELPFGTKPKTSVSFFTWLAAFVVFSVILVIVSGSIDSLSLPIVVALVFVLLGALSVATSPLELAAARMLIYASVLAGATIGLSGGAIRSTLVRFQTDPESTIGIAAQLKDTQVTWGYFLAIIGIVLVFLGAVAQWARRRDALQAAARIAAQRAAAEASAAEIAAARAKAGL
jgi:hypothetical protein